MNTCPLKNEQKGGDVIRDGASILPTGRNIYALDPYRVPSTLAMIRGKEAVEQILAAHRKTNADSFPETVAVTLWVFRTWISYCMRIHLYAK